MTRFKLLILAVSLILTAPLAAADPNQRTIVLRERASTTLLYGSFSFKLMKMRGYSIDIKIADAPKRTLKLGQSFTPPKSTCSITFEENSPETRLARFKTDCP